MNCSAHRSTDAFRAVVDWCVERRKTVIAITFGVFVLGLAGFRFVEQQFFPDSVRPELMVELWLPEGSSFRNTEAATKEFEAWVKGQPGVASYTAFVAAARRGFICRSMKSCRKPMWRN